MTRRSGHEEGTVRDPARVVAFSDGQGERTAVVLHGLAFELAAGLFNVIWWYARRDRRLLASTVDDAGVRAIARRFQLALAWIGTATVLGALLPVLGVCVFTTFLAYYWLPVSGELGRVRPGRVPPGPEDQTERTSWSCAGCVEDVAKSGESFPVAVPGEPEA